jgi:hypothetical protein
MKAFPAFSRFGALQVRWALTIRNIANILSEEEKGAKDTCCNIL